MDTLSGATRMPNADHPIKIIVVSSDLLMSDYLRSILDPQKFTVEAVEPTPEGIAGTRKFSPDLFVIDELESGLDVLNTCQIIRQYSIMPIMVMSSNHKPGLVEQTLDAGADEYLTKPISGSVLIAHLNTLARRAMAEKEAALSIVHGGNQKPDQLGLLAY